VEDDPFLLEHEYPPEPQQVVKNQFGERFAAELPKLPADAQVLLIGALTKRREANTRPAITEGVSSKDGAVRLAALTARATSSIYKMRTALPWRKR